MLVGLLYRTLQSADKQIEQGMGGETQSLHGVSECVTLYKCHVFCCLETLQPMSFGSLPRFHCISMIEECISVSRCYWYRECMLWLDAVRLDGESQHSLSGSFLAGVNQTLSEMEVLTTTFRQDEQRTHGQQGQGRQKILESTVGKRNSIFYELPIIGNYKPEIG